MDSVNNDESLIDKKSSSPTSTIDANSIKITYNEVIEDPLISYKMLEALRKSDEQMILNLWSQWPKAENSAQSMTLKSYNSPLHLSVTCASIEINKFVITKLKGIKINQQDIEGNTPLHLAAKGGRSDIVELLLSFEDIDDTILNSDCKTALQLATSQKVKEIFQIKRQEFINEKSLFLDHHLAQATQANVKAVLDFFETNPRASLIDINHRHSKTGVTILHQAVTLGDNELVGKLLKLGANVFARDRKGKLPIDIAREESVKSLLKKETSQTLVASDPNQLPRLEGQLKKWTNFAVGYKSRWFVLENGYLTYFKSQEDKDNAVRGSLNLVNSQLWIDSADPQRFEITGKDKTRFQLRASMLAEAKMWILAITQTKEWFKKHPQESANPPDHTIGRKTSTIPESLSTSTQSSSLLQLPSQPQPVGTPSEDESTIKIERYQRSRSNSVDSINYEPPPIDEEVNMAINSATTQFDLHARLLEMLKSSLSSSGSKPEDQLGLLSTLSQSLGSIEKLHHDAVEMLQKREEYYRKLYERESHQNGLWTESLQKLAKEHHHLAELYQAQHAEHAALSKREYNSGVVDKDGNHSSNIAGYNEVEYDEEDEEDEEDEFYDLDEPNESSDEKQGTNEPQTQIEAGKSSINEAEEVLVIGNEEISRVPVKRSYQGYPKDGTFRNTLPKFQSGTQPPAVSLWSVLKNAIGKDLTKISLPVHFNEPSSMLQRMAEDMEYSRLLDLAVKQMGDGPERLLWVTAFAMSNYSSTDGRIAKPFNPLLGETFEYVRPDKNYRYISEQVSHHPPISACYCESPNYVFFSEVNVKSNFWGKSYELLPQGVCHVYLFLDNGKRIEHYTWKKVTTAVTNLIVGNPTIESYGDMIVTNHNTKDVCKLTFKPNRWLSSERHALEGTLTTGSGKDVWSLSGAWHQQLTAERIGGGSEAEGNEELHHDCDDEPGSKLSRFLANPSTQRSLRLWKRTPPPKEAIPFKLTPFALTLNELPEDLKPLLPPTDCRHRPDQRAMEDGLYDDASQEKLRLEEKQRKVRREREAAIQSALNQANTPEEEKKIRENMGHHPMWFVRDVDNDTNEPYWRFTHEYWKRRELASKHQDDAWKDVPDIF